MHSQSESEEETPNVNQTEKKINLAEENQLERIKDKNIELILFDLGEVRKK